MELRAILPFLALAGLCGLSRAQAPPDPCQGAVGVQHDPALLRFVHHKDATDPGTEIKYNDVASLRSSHLRRHCKKVFLVDGFLSNQYNSIMTPTLTSALTSSHDFPCVDVITVYWDHLSGGMSPLVLSGNLTLISIALNTLGPCVSLNVGPAGSRVGDFIQFLVSTRYAHYDLVQVIGHSMGAHVAGNAGQHLKQQNILVGQITGLDPSGPGCPQQLPFAALQKGQARYVDMYHTDIYGLGSNCTNLADTEVFINGGHNQPGCPPAIPGNPLPQHYCWHQYSYRFYQATIRDHDLFAFDACPCQATPPVTGSCFASSAPKCHFWEAAHVGYHGFPWRRGNVYITSTDPYIG